ncbi:MAG TPA: ABC transporter substrate-binding protein [Frankiaceae bacterium]|nr:ABC transporter substrate-binding protein [Frankiaceae bacterium]
MRRAVRTLALRDLGDVPAGRASQTLPRSRSSRRRSLRPLLAVLALLLTACDPGGRSPGAEVPIVVSAPLSSSPWVAKSVVNGARLAVEELNAQGPRRFKLVELDHGDDVQRALANARAAVDQDAAALVTDGVGAVAVAGVAGPADLPVFVTYEGGEGLVDEDARPTLFRMAPANRPMTNRLMDYLAGRKPRIALLTDDTGYGRDGRDDIKRSIERGKLTLTTSVEIATGADPAPQVLAAQKSGADTVVVWARAPVVASVITAIRTRGWQVPIFTGPTAEDPLVRQQLAQHPEWLDGTEFVSFRITAEIGPEPFRKFRAAYEKKFGPDRIGVGDVVQPPDWAMYSYDSVRLIAAALDLTGGKLGEPLVKALNEAAVTGANGDERSFLPRNHEGVSSDDMYIARFRDMRFAPVKEDILSASLPTVPQ